MLREKYARERCGPFCRNGGSDDRRLKSKSDNAGTSFDADCDHAFDPEEEVAPFRPRMLRFSVDLFRAAKPSSIPIYQKM
jgi:hypothetical protein